jgi:hypothetical protein
MLRSSHEFNYGKSISNFINAIQVVTSQRMKIKKRKRQPAAIIGWREWITLPELGIPAVKAKIDTGARTSAIHIFNLEELETDDRPMVRFGIHPLQRRQDIKRICEAPVIDRRRVKDSGGHLEKRYVIQTTAVMGVVRWTINLTLTNRDPMMFRMLLGRTAVENRFLIDPARSYLTGRKLAKAYQTEMNKSGIKTPSKAR